MAPIRVIARLDIKGPNLVKGVHLEGLRVLGRPEEFAKFYYENGADEIIFQDVVASLYNRNSLSEIIKRTAENIFIPITVGGGIRTLADINNTLRAGADKVAINTAAIHDHNFVRKAVGQFGSSTIVIAIECIQQKDGTYLAFTDNGREHTGIEVTQWARTAEDLGAGEILLTSVDRDGTGLGFDINLLKSVTEAVSVPVIAHGGAGSVDHYVDAVLRGDASAIAIASAIHYQYLTSKIYNDQTSDEGNYEFIRSGKTSYNKIKPHTLQQIKEHLISHKIECRAE